MGRCPICARELPADPRYPRRACSQCARRARSPDGRPLAFYNEGLSGGLLARYADTGEDYPGVECLIDGIPCRAGEARFGGVVLQVIGKGGEGAPESPA